MRKTRKKQGEKEMNEQVRIVRTDQKTIRTIQKDSVRPLEERAMKIWSNLDSALPVIGEKLMWRKEIFRYSESYFYFYFKQFQNAEIKQKIIRLKRVEFNCKVRERAFLYQLSFFYQS